MVKLSDKNIVPTDELIFSMTGDKKLLWDWILRNISEKYADISGSWNWYDDGKQWLYRLTRRRKTIYWASLTDNTFRITFWFSDKAEPLIEKAILPPSVKDRFRKARKSGLVRPVSITIQEQSDAANVISLAEVKQMLK